MTHLNRAGIAARGSARGQVPGTDQRSAMIYASTVDLEEAYKVGRNAVAIAVEDGGGFMSTILRRPGDIYSVDYDKVPLETVANSEREFPARWIAASRIDVTDDFVRYARAADRRRLGECPAGRWAPAFRPAFAHHRGEEVARLPPAGTSPVTASRRPADRRSSFLVWR